MSPRGPYKGGHNEHTDEMDRLLAERPPVIRWAKNKRGVMVAIEVRDPHAEKGFEAQLERMRENADRMEREEARQAVAYAEQRRLDDTRLMISARNPI